MIIIGIAGPSCSGKSSIARRVAERLNTDVLSLDQFAIKGAEKVFVDYNDENIRSFEQPQLYDGSRMARVIRTVIDEGTCTFESMKIPEHILEEKTLQKKGYLVVEGFLLFTYPEIIPLIDHKVYIDLNETEVFRRRAIRSSLPKSDESFMKIGMREYERFGAGQKYTPGVIMLNGMKSLDELASEILHKILEENPVPKNKK